MDYNNIIKKFKKVYTNRYKAEENGCVFPYRDAELYNMAREAFASGEKYFYATRCKNNKLCKAEPEYIYCLNTPLTAEEYNAIASKLII